MSSSQPTLEQQIHALQQENAALRAELARLQERAAAGREARGKVARIGWRVLVPLLDRQKVVRSFANLANTTADFAGPSSQWPNRDQVLLDARTFAESCVRFIVRRRTFLMIFSLIAALIPAIQIYLVFQQNDIINKQNEFFEIQVYDILGRTMAEADPNARLVTGGLLANAKVEFLQGVVLEAFHEELEGSLIITGDKEAAARQGLAAAALRGHLIRAVARAIQLSGRDDSNDPDELYDQARVMLKVIAKDAATRIPFIVRSGRTPLSCEDDDDIDGGCRRLPDEAAYYIYQVGNLLKSHSRLARLVDRQGEFFSDIGPLLQRLAGLRGMENNRFGDAYRLAMETFLFDLAAKPELNAPPVTPDKPDEAMRQGLDTLRSNLGGDRIDWEQLSAQLGVK